jgi:hypothetical protein
MKVPPGFVLKRTYGAVSDALVHSVCDAVISYKKATFATMSETSGNLADSFAPWPLLYSGEASLTQPLLGNPRGVAYKRAQAFVATSGATILHTTLLMLEIGSLFDRSYAEIDGILPIDRPLDLHRAIDVLCQKPL